MARHAKRATVRDIPKFFTVFSLLHGCNFVQSQKKGELNDVVGVQVLFSVTTLRANIIITLVHSGPPVPVFNSTANKSYQLGETSFPCR